MSRGFTGTTQKQRRSPHNGNIHHPRGQRKHGRSAATSRFCWPFFSTPVEWCFMNTHNKAKLSPNSTKRGYFVAFVMLCGANDRTCGSRILAAPSRQCTRLFFISDSKFFWLNTIFPWFVRLPTLPTWFLVIFGCSTNWKCRWKGPDLSQEKTLCGTRLPSCTRFHKKFSGNVSSNGRTAGRSVCITKETTLKGIRVSDVKINNCIFADQSSDTFCTAHVAYTGCIWNAWTNFRSEFPTLTQEKKFISIYVHEQFSWYSPNVHLTAVPLDLYLWGILKPPVYSAPIKNVETLHQHILDTCLDHLQLLQGFWKGVAVHDQTGPCMHWFSWRTFGAFLVNCDLIK